MTGVDSHCRVEYLMACTKLLLWVFFRSHFESAWLKLDIILDLQLNVETRNRRRIWTRVIAKYS